MKEHDRRSRRLREPLHQSLSAAVDGEASEFELRRLLDEVEENPALRSAWSRYHALSALMQGELVEPVGDLAARVRTASADAVQAGARRRWRWPAAAALAASVAIAALVGLNAPEPESRALQVAASGVGATPDQPLQQVAAIERTAASQSDPDESTSLLELAARSGNSPLPTTTVDTRMVSRVEAGPRSVWTTPDRRRMNAYMIEHLQHKAVSHPDLGAYTKLAAYQAGGQEAPP